MQRLASFRNWLRKNRPRRGILCHFYIAGKTKPYYGKIDFAYFNLISESKEWIVGGTEGHGVMSKSRKRSRIACLNCYEVDDKFLEALGELDPAQNDKYEIGLILNKRKLKLGGHFKVEDVELKRGWGEPVPYHGMCYLNIQSLRT